MGKRLVYPHSVTYIDRVIHSWYPVRRCPVAFAFVLLAAGVATAGMTHRWSFAAANGPAPTGTVLVDRISGHMAHVRGHGAEFSGGVLLLPGTTRSDASPATISAYVDLPNHLLGGSDHFSLEAWVTVHSLKSWQRLFEFGRTSFADNTAIQGPGALPGEVLHTATSNASSMQTYDSLSFSLNRGMSANTQRLYARNNAAGELYNDASRTLTAGAVQHLVIIFERGLGTYATSGGQLRWYQNGAFGGSLSLPFRLSSIEDVNNWIGRAQTNTHSCSHMSLHEVRLYDHPLSSAEIVASRDAGADAEFAAPVAANDSLEMSLQQKVRIEVLANDTGNITPSTLVIDQPPTHGTAVADRHGRILYTHLSGAPSSDSFTYRISGPGSFSEPATVTVTFSPSLRVERHGIHVPDSPPPVSLQLVEAFPGLNFDFPVAAGSPPNDNKRLFVATRTGQLRVIPDVASLEPTSSVVLYFDTRVGGLFRGKNPAEQISRPVEMGLLGFAFHPDYAQNGWLFLSYNVEINSLNYHRLSRVTMGNRGNPVPTMDSNSEVVLFEIHRQGTIHNAGDIHFGPDGYLYISLGDEGGQNDQFQNSQRIDRDFYSGVMRIDVDKRPGNLEPNPHPNPAYDPDDTQRDAVVRVDGEANYAIPIDNPFVHTSLGGEWDGRFLGEPLPDPSFARSEFWAVGLRSPWRMSFDPASGDLWVGDVGNTQREELNLVEKGANYGWAFHEGALAGPKTGVPVGYPHTPPYYEYPHGSGPYVGNSVIGGIVYHGSRIPDLQGTYIFGDYVSGNIWALVKNPDAPPTIERILGKTGISAFARDPSNGDVLLMDYLQNRLLRLVVNNTGEDFPATLSETGVFADLTDLSPAPGVLPYSINLPFWSDHAVKRRWFSMPSTDSHMSYSRDGNWGFPSGQIWVKHFDLESVRGNPTTARRLETRLLVKTTDGAYGVSYRWNDAGTEAYLVEDAGQELDIAVEVNGQPYVQRWRIPARSDCMSCHTPQAGYALSFQTRQLNMEKVIHGFGGNQLTTLGDAGCLHPQPPPSHLLPRHVRPDESAFSLEDRARSYLAVNCAYCHHPGGTAAPSQWDGLIHTPLFSTGMVHGIPAQTGNMIDPRIIFPGHPERSTLVQRLSGAQGLGRMPPLATHEIDEGGIALITAWIAGWPEERVSYDDWRETHFGNAHSPEGEPDAVHGNDGITNRTRFLFGVTPQAIGPLANPWVSQNENSITLGIQLPPGRSAVAEHSDDLQHWLPWSVQGNHGLPDENGEVRITAPPAGTSGFFRFSVQEK